MEVPVRTAAANDDGDVMRMATLGFTKAIIAMGGGGIYDTNLRRRSYYPRKSPGTAHRNDFMASYLTAAGARNLLADDGPRNPVKVTHEEVLSLAKEADVWIANDSTDVNWPPASYLNAFRAYRTGRVYHYQKRAHYEHDAFDWYETAEVRPDLVLEDLVSIFYPAVLPNHELFFFKKIFLTKQTGSTR